MNAEILSTGLGWTVSGHADITEYELLSQLEKQQVDIMERADSMAESGKSYLINHGIEMLIGSENHCFQIMQLRICLSWITTGLQESYEVLQIISQICPILDWTTNAYGEPIGTCEQFVDRHLTIIKERYDFFCKVFPHIEDVRLTEAEFQKYYPKRNRKIFRYRRNLSQYKPIFSK